MSPHSETVPIPTFLAWTWTSIITYKYLKTAGNLDLLVFCPSNPPLLGHIWASNLVIAHWGAFGRVSIQMYRVTFPQTGNAPNSDTKERTSQFVFYIWDSLLALNYISCRPFCCFFLKTDESNGVRHLSNSICSLVIIYHLGIIRKKEMFLSCETNIQFWSMFGLPALRKNKQTSVGRRLSWGKTEHVFDI